MAILHNCVQYSEEYDRLKLGMPTSSNFHKILTPRGKPSAQWDAYAYHLIAERLLRRKVDSYTSRPMERGVIVEAEAAEWYEFDRDQTTERIGFVTTDDGRIGCSPDRLIGDIGLLEIKCPGPPGQVKYLLTGQPDTDHWPQLQGQLWITEREWVDILCWHDELPRIVVRAKRDKTYIDKLSAEINKFLAYIETVMDKIGSVQAMPKAALKDMLRASLEASP
jgi:hypothetical protein